MKLKVKYQVHGGTVLVAAILSLVGIVFVLYYIVGSILDAVGILAGCLGVSVTLFFLDIILPLPSSDP